MIKDKKNLDQNQTKNDLARKELDDELKETQEDQGDAIEQDQEENKEEEEKEDEDKEDEEDEEIEEKEDEEEEEEEDEENKEDEEEKDKEKNKIERPQKYIPLKKYKDEKGKWKSDREELKKANETIAELKTANSKEETKFKRKETLKKIADKFDTSIEFLEELSDVMSEGREVEPEAIIDKKETEKKPVSKKPLSNDQIVKLFDDEFDGFIKDVIKEEYPNANEEQIEDVKKLMDQHAHTDKYKRYPLNDIMKLNKKDFSDILADNPSNNGVEGGKPGSGKFKKINNESFKENKDGYYNFDLLHKMDEGKAKAKIVQELKPEQWNAYVNDIENGEGVKVKKKDGREIHLK